MSQLTAPFSSSPPPSKGSALVGGKYGVFGCGNRDWMQTYERIPTLCNALFAQHGGEQLVPRGEGDAGGGEFFESFDNWEALVWESLTKAYNTKVEAAPTAGIDVQTVSTGTARTEVLRQAGTALGTVVENRVLTAPGAPVKRHIAFELPEGMTSRAGAYLAILLTNPPRDVKRAIARFGLSPEQEVTLSSGGPTSLPVGKPIILFTLLSGYVELSQPATTRDLDLLAKVCASPTSSAALAVLSISYSELRFRSACSSRCSPRCASDSTRSHPRRSGTRAVHLSVSVLEAPAISGRAEPFLGVGSTYLAELRPGDNVQLAVRASNAVFHPPADLAVPLVMFCAGAGLAPMRGFLQERAMQKKAGRDVTTSLLFFGCRAPKEDYLYAGDDLKEWAESGVVDVRPAFSRISEESLGCKYVQDRVWHDRADIVQAFIGGCKFFVCGSGKAASGVKAALVRVIKEQKKVGDAEAAAAFNEITSGRLAMDLFEASPLLNFQMEYIVFLELRGQQKRQWRHADFLQASDILDSGTAHILTGGPVFIVTTSFEGQPADDAKHFVKWLATSRVFIFIFSSSFIVREGLSLS
ncbi:hypothetical protein A0H81_14533 [Grifola frondosa]|uniref:FAD-binding FR-type domain-containing protein n=1 Tax=Grifola frondosa TaxID=5627 RepID=A0A1C7LL09_GRIFR|nr:hypothetical protein A0H81_14533 [Grifola frondosa]